MRQAAMIIRLDPNPRLLTADIPAWGYPRFHQLLIHDWPWHDVGVEIKKMVEQADFEDFADPCEQAHNLSLLKCLC